MNAHVRGFAVDGRSNPLRAANLIHDRTLDSLGDVLAVVEARFLGLCVDPQRAFGLDELAPLPDTGRRLDLVPYAPLATFMSPLVARKILAHLGLRSEPPAQAPARPPPQASFA